MKIVVNGVEQFVQEMLTVQAFLESKKINPQTVIVERNQEILKRLHLPEIVLAEGDCLEIVRFMAGG